MQNPAGSKARADKDDNVDGNIQKKIQEDESRIRSKEKAKRMLAVRPDV